MACNQALLDFELQTIQSKAQRPSYACLGYVCFPVRSATPIEWPDIARVPGGNMY